MLSLAWALVTFAVHMLVVLRALTRPNRSPASRIAWIAVILLAPFVGMIAYLLLGETSVGQARVERLRKAAREISPPDETSAAHGLLPQMASLFDLARSVNGFQAVDGNRLVLLTDPEAPADEPMRHSKCAIEAMLRDIAQATHQVHMAVYIWLDDHTGRRMAAAVADAARRGVQCRVMVDALGSRAFTRSATWRQMSEAGVRLQVTLRDIARWRHVAFSRVDLRDHRKILVVDNRIAYCGSQNCADPEFRVKAQFAPWIDLMIRCEGPVARQMQWLFLSGWIPETGETGLEHLPAARGDQCFESGCVAHMFGTGPTAIHNAMSDMFVACLYAAREELIITTPYFVPDESILRALCAAARRGVRTTLILPARNDSWFVGNASRSTYSDLLDNGVVLCEYPLGLLHAKSLTIDGRIALVGSANMDRRSLELNYENSLLIADQATVGAIRQRQMEYLSCSHAVTAEAVRTRPFYRRVVQNMVGMMAPVL
ncbi:MAG: cardiolipin synthase [Steroidobacteraceae bacterium]